MSNYYSYDNDQGEIVGHAEVGDPPAPTKLKEGIQTLLFSIHNFSEREESRGECVKTPSLVAHGYEWYLQVYPRGDVESSKVTERVSIFLANKCDPSKAPYATGMIRTLGKEVALAMKNYKTPWGFRDFMGRESFLNTCLDENGTLEVYVDIQMADEQVGTWFPKKLCPDPSHEKLWLRAQGHDDADDLETVNIFVDNKLFLAHPFVLAERGAELYDMVDITKHAMTTFTGVTSSTFHILLEYIYTAKQPKFETMEDTKVILDAANRFGVATLKLLAESTLVDKFLIPSTAAHLLLFADSKVCPLLKEACLELHLSSPDEVEQDAEWSLVEASNDLLCEIYKFPRFKQKVLQQKLDVAHSDIQYLMVGTLRQRLEEANLDLDGTRAMLVARLMEQMVC